MRILAGIGLLVVVAAMSMTFSGRAAAEPAVTVRSDSGATCTADYIFLHGKEHAPFIIFTYFGTGGPVKIIFRMTTYRGLPAVYAERAIIGTGEATILEPFGREPAAIFGPTQEFELTESGSLEPTGNVSLFAVGADIRQVLRTAVTDFCDNFDPSWLTQSRASMPVTTPTPAPTRTPTPTPTAR